MLRSGLNGVSTLLLLPSIAVAAYPDAVQVLIEEGLHVETSFEAPGGIKGLLVAETGIRFPFT